MTARTGATWARVWCRPVASQKRGSARNLARTKAALGRYDKLHRKFCQAFDVSPMPEQVEVYVMLADLDKALDAVRRAYALDTSDVNRMEDCADLRESVLRERVEAWKRRVQA